MRPLILGAGLLLLGLGLGLGACDQDYAASNADRHSFMGEIKAAPLPSASQAATLPPPALPTNPPAVTAAPSSSTAPAASASAAPAHSATPAPAGSGHH